MKPIEELRVLQRLRQRAVDTRDLNDSHLFFKETLAAIRALSKRGASRGLTAGDKHILGAYLAETSQFLEELERVGGVSRTPHPSQIIPSPAEQARLQEEFHAVSEEIVALLRQ